MELEGRPANRRLTTSVLTAQYQQCQEGSSRVLQCNGIHWACSHNDINSPGQHGSRSRMLGNRRRRRMLFITVDSKEYLNMLDSSQWWSTIKFFKRCLAYYRQVAREQPLGYHIERKQPVIRIAWLLHAACVGLHAVEEISAKLRSRSGGKYHLSFNYLNISAPDF